jgi:hypothetical protein
MLFLADECCDALVVRTLRELGHDVTYVAELGPGLTDTDVLAQSVSEERFYSLRIETLVNWFSKDKQWPMALCYCEFCPKTVSRNRGE